MYYLISLMDEEDKSHPKMQDWVLCLGDTPYSKRLPLAHLAVINSV